MLLLHGKSCAGQLAKVKQAHKSLCLKIKLIDNGAVMVLFLVK